MAAWKVPWTYVVWATMGTARSKVAMRVRIEGTDRGDILWCWCESAVKKYFDKLYSTALLPGE